jgi:peptidyl-prolyl cis-trans isomerase C
MKIVATITLLAVLQSAAALAGEPDSIVFQGGDVTVRYRDVERYIAENTPQDPKERAAVLDKPGIYREMAEMLYTLQVLAAEAESQPDFDREQAEWNAHIIYQRRIIKDLRDDYVRQKLKDVNWEATARETYQVQKKQYMTDEMVQASHILINVNETRNDEAAKALALELRERALKGEDFGALAKRYSADPSVVRNSGNLGFFKRGQLVKPFEDAAFAMQEPGAISEVVKTPFGYHVIRYEARKAPEQIPFDTVKAKIIEELQTNMGNKLWEDKLVAIRSARGIVVDEALLRELQEKYQTEATPK